MRSRLASLDVRAVTGAAVAAAVASTLAQLAHWFTITDALPGILFRDVRFAAAIVLGAPALQRPDDDVVAWLAASAVHLALSLVYAVVIALLVQRRAWPLALAIGTIAGAAIFAANMYGFTTFWPWFEAARDPITLAAHVVFGVVAAATYRALTVRGR